jgi:uncharacterized sulfatase
MLSRRLCIVLMCLLWLTGVAPAGERPNILWLTCEDIGPQLGCYGDSYADTPHLDRFARRSLLYRHAWSNAPVCAPARTTLISGIYPTSTGSEHMRSETRLPPELKMYPVYLREAGYYCINPGKEDYNLAKAGRVWDPPPKGDQFEHLRDHQPFLAVLNHTGTHESQIRRRPHELVHDPAGVRVPAYHPDTPVVRRDWAQYYDNITVMDRWFHEQLQKLEAAGLSENTIVFFYGDHGSGMPRSKRYPYNSGLQVPLLIHIPERFRDLAPPDYQPGGSTERLVSFVDFAPTLLSLAGVAPPPHLQGKPFLGKHRSEPEPYLYGFRGRMDERLDLQRSVTNGRYVYIRNYMPHKIPGQHVSYMFETPTTAQWRAMYDRGELTEAQQHFWRPKPTEELYDLQQDPDEVENLADSPEHQEILQELRAAHQAWAFRTRDLGLLPEGEIHARAVGTTPYAVGQDPQRYPLERIFPIAQLASDLKANDLAPLAAALQDADSGVRYWGVLGLRIHGKDAVVAQLPELRRLLQQEDSVFVRNAAAETLALYGNPEDFTPAVNHLVRAADGNRFGVHSAIQALNALSELGDRVQPWSAQLKALPAEGEWSAGRFSSYVPRLLEELAPRLAP